MLSKEEEFVYGTINSYEFLVLLKEFIKDSLKELSVDYVEVERAASDTLTISVSIFDAENKSVFKGFVFSTDRDEEVKKYYLYKFCDDEILCGFAYKDLLEAVLKLDMGCHKFVQDKLFRAISKVFREN